MSWAWEKPEMWSQCSCVTTSRSISPLPPVSLRMSSATCRSFVGSPGEFWKTPQSISTRTGLVPVAGGNVSRKQSPRPWQYIRTLTTVPAFVPLLPDLERVDLRFAADLLAEADAAFFAIGRGPVLLVGVEDGERVTTSRIEVGVGRRGERPGSFEFSLTIEPCVPLGLDRLADAIADLSRLRVDDQ